MRLPQKIMHLSKRNSCRASGLLKNTKKIIMKQVNFVMQKVGNNIRIHARKITIIKQILLGNHGL